MIVLGGHQERLPTGGGLKDRQETTIMQTIMSQAEISSLSTGALSALIRELEGEIARERSPNVRSRLETVLRAARAELARRQPRFTPRPPGF